MSNKEVIKHSSAIAIHNKINLVQRKAWNVLLANAYDDLLEKDTHQINIKDLMETIKYESRNIEHLKATVKALVSCVVEWNILKKDNQEWGVSGLLAAAVIKGGKLEYSYSPQLKQKLFNPSMYARIKLSIQQRFNSRYTLALYELCIDYLINRIEKGQTPWIDINDYRKLMGIEVNEYKQFKRLNEWTIKGPIEEINEKSDLHIKVEFKREKRNVSAIKFFIKPKPKNNDIEERLITLPNGTNLFLYERLTRYFQLSEVQAREALKDYSEDHISENLAYVEAKYKKGEINNLGAYTLKALTDNYSRQKSLFDVEKEEEDTRKVEAEKQKKTHERLQDAYNSFVRLRIEEYRESLSEDDLKAKNRVAEEEAVKQYGPKNLALKIMTRMILEKTLAEETGIPSFDEWEKQQSNLAIVADT